MKLQQTVSNRATLKVCKPVIGFFQLTSSGANCSLESLSFQHVQGRRGLSQNHSDDIFFIISSFIFHVNYSTKALEMLDQPYKLVIPNIIKYDPIHPCLFSSYVDIIIIGLIVKYTRSFDLLKGYTNYKYFTMSLILLGLGCLGTFLFYLLYLKLVLK